MLVPARKGHVGWAIFCLLFTTTLFGCSAGRVQVAPEASERRSVEKGYVGFWPSTVKLGRVRWYDEVPFVARFVNFGDQPVSLAALRSPCGCTTIDQEHYLDKTVQPGESLEIPGSIHIGGRLGNHSKEIVVLLSNGTTHTMNIEYDTYATYVLKPDHLDFGNIKLEDDEETEDLVQRALFRSDETKLLRVDDGGVRWLENALVPHGADEAEIVVHLVKRYLSHGNNLAQLGLVTDDATKPYAYLPVRAFGVADLRPVPSHLFLPRGLSGKVSVMTSKGEMARIVEAGTDAEGIEVRIGKDQYQVEVLLHECPDEPIRVTVESDQGSTTWFLVSCAPRS